MSTGMNVTNPTFSPAGSSYQMVAMVPAAHLYKPEPVEKFEMPGGSAAAAGGRALAPAPTEEATVSIPRAEMPQVPEPVLTPSPRTGGAAAAPTK